jgi:hypothetical protein
MADFFGEHSTSIFRVEVCKSGVLLHVNISLPLKKAVGKMVIDIPSQPKVGALCLLALTGYQPLIPRDCFKH